MEPSTQNPMLEADNLTKRYEDDTLALDHVSFNIYPGQVYAMLGGNGAGKTTAINLFLNFIEPTEGEARVDGIVTHKEPLKAKKKLAYVSENVMLYPNFTALQNLDFFARLGGKTTYTKDDYRQVLLRVGLEKEAHDRRLKGYSKGMQEDDDSRQLLQEEIAENERIVNEDLRNRKSEQERLAFVLSRFSPSSSYQLAAMNLAGTNTTLKGPYEESMKIYRTAFSQFVEDKRIEERKKMMEQQRGQRRFMFFGGGDESLDLSELPRYEAPSHTFSEAFAPSVVDVGLLALFSVLCFAGAFVAFLRYDVR